MYLNGRSWAPWVERARGRGFEPARLRETLDPGLGHLTFGDVVASLKSVIDALPERPLLIGHSIGGLVTQKLLADGYARAAVAISSAPPQGVLTLAPDFLHANWPHLNPFAGNRPIRMTKPRFHYTFATTMTRAGSDAAFDQLAVPESRNVPRSTLASQAHIDFAADHAPLLMLAGDTDHLTPEALIRKNAASYRQPVPVRTFTNRSHFICNQPGWEEVAGASFDFLEQQFAD